MNSSELKSVEQPQNKSGEVYILADIKAKEQISQSEFLTFQTCTRVDNNQRVLSVAPKGYPSFHLPKDIAKSTLSTLRTTKTIAGKDKPTFLEWTKDIDALKNCQ